MTLTSSWRPSWSRTGPTSRQRLIFAGARLRGARSRETFSHKARKSSGERRSARALAGWPARRRGQGAVADIDGMWAREPARRAGRAGQRLAPMGERGLHERAQRGTTAGRSAPGPRAPSRRWAPGGRPCATRAAGPARRTRDSSSARRRRRCPPWPRSAARPLLHHRHPALHAGAGPGRIAVAAMHVGRYATTFVGSGSSAVQVEVERVGDVQRRVRVGLERLAQRRLQREVDLHDVDVARERGEVLGQHAEAAADLEHDVLRAELRRPADDAEDVRVDEEVLAEVALGPDVEVGEPAQTRLGHHRSSAAAVASTAASSSSYAMLRAALGDEPRGVHHVGRLVALPPHGLRAEPRSVRLHEQAIGGHTRHRRGQRVVGGVGHVARRRSTARARGTRRSGRASRSSGGSRRCRPRGRTAARSSRPRPRGSG